MHHGDADGQPCFFGGHLRVSLQLPSSELIMTREDVIQRKFCDFAKKRRFKSSQTGEMQVDLTPAQSFETSN
ncbi:hypothetical protein [Dongshaea marina]|uniref:hypothetical protein n=1 Tax=Dongshaea marina TaxID=2047966 RepID=UPI000D3E45C1|nr:hypothetical protein [Dongshaea marina]